MKTATIIKRRMEDERVTPAEMAAGFQITERTWYNWMARPKKHITLERANAIANVLHMTDEEFLKMTRCA